MYKFKNSFLKSFILLELLIVVILVSWYTFKVMQLHNFLIDKELESAYQEIDAEFTHNIYAINTMLRNVSHNIYYNTSHQQINTIFSEFDSKIKEKVQELISWNTLTWLDNEHFMRVNSARGVLTPPYRKEQKYFTNECKGDLERLKIGYTSRSPNLKRLVLPLCLGISDGNKHVGTITTSFDIERLVRKLTKIINNEAISFAVMNKENIIAFESPDYFISDYINEQINVARPVSDYSFYADRNIPHLMKGSYKTLMKETAFGYKIIVATNEKVDKSRIYKAIIDSFFDLLAIIALISMLIIFVYKQLVKPILELSSHAEVITAGNDGGKIKKYKYIELKILANAVKNVLSQQKELVEANMKLEQLLKEKAEIANKAKSDFIRNIQHELKTPLNHILGSTDILANEILGAKISDYKEYVRIINLSGRELLETINNLIIAAELATGKTKLNKRLGSIRELVDVAIGDIESKAVIKKITIKEDIEPKLPLIFIDMKQLQKAIVCVLNNSISFTNQGGVIAINAYKMDHSVILEIIDNGIGIKDKDLGKITEMFEYSEEVLTKSNKGLGLGLSIVKNILDLHSIKLEITSEVNSGTQVRFIIPTPEKYK